VVYTFEPYENEKGQLICGARTRQGIPCTRPALAGDRRCRAHTHRESYKAHLKDGKYSKYLDEPLKDKFDEFVTDPELTDLSSEVALLRARLASEPDAPLRLVADVCDRIGKLVERMTRREEGMKVTITVDRLMVMVNAISGVIKTELRRCPHCGQPLTPLQERIARQIASLRLFERTDDDTDVL